MIQKVVIDILPSANNFPGNNVFICLRSTVRTTFFSSIFSVAEFITRKAAQDICIYKPQNFKCIQSIVDIAVLHRSVKKGGCGAFRTTSKVSGITQGKNSWGEQIAYAWVRALHNNKLLYSLPCLIKILQNSNYHSGNMQSLSSQNKLLLITYQTSQNIS